MNSVNTNLGALIAQKNMESVEGKMQKAMERLSSGLRINNAADDAAGSAIASRMEASVRSLSQAVRNSHDAISMTQTAEGALGEIENILQRMRELTVQAGNSTLNATDRSSIQKEVDALTAEIDSIATQANFNGVKLLDGSKSQLQFQVGANDTDNLKVDLIKTNTTSLGLGGANKGVSELTSQRATQVNYAAGTVTLHAADIKINGRDWTTTDYVTNSSGADAAKLLADAINLNTAEHGAEARAFNTVTGTAGGTFSVDDIFTINLQTVEIANNYNDLVTNINNVAPDVVATLNADNSITLSNNSGEQIEVFGSGAVAAGFVADTYNGFIALSNLDGTGVRIEAKTVQNGYEDNTTNTASISQLQLLGFNEQSVAGVIETANVGASTPTASSAITSEDNIFINDVKIGPSLSASASHKADAINALSAEHGVVATAKNVATIEINGHNLLSAGTEVTVQGVTVDLKAATSVASVATAINDLSGIGDVVATTDKFGRLVLTSERGDTIIMKDTSGSSVVGSQVLDINGVAVTKSSNEATVVGNLTLQSVGGDAIKVSGDTADNGSDTDHLALIGINGQSAEQTVTSTGVNVETLLGATTALSSIDKAIETVSSHRSSFGASENRLDAIINNLTTLKVNTQAAQSRIEDADFASETTNLTKSQILSQAATSMLAQANASRQNLLALLQG